jgi:hypothetical protein
MNTQRFGWKKGPNQAKKGWNIDGTSRNTLFPSFHCIALDTMNGFFREGVHNGSQCIFGTQFENRKVGMGKEGKTVVDKGLSMWRVVYCSKIVDIAWMLAEIIA